MGMMLVIDTDVDVNANVDTSAIGGGTACDNCTC